MKSYLLSVLGWAIGSLIIIIIPIVGGFWIFLYTFSVLCSPLLGPVGNLYVSYILKNIGFKILNPFITSLIGALIFFLFPTLFLMISIVFKIQSIAIIGYYWIGLWIIVGPLILLFKFLNKRA